MADPLPEIRDQFGGQGKPGSHRMASKLVKDVSLRGNGPGNIDPGYRAGGPCCGVTFTFSNQDHRFIEFLHQA